MIRARPALLGGAVNMTENLPLDDSPDLLDKFVGAAEVVDRRGGLEGEGR